MELVRFEWDPVKAEANVRNHSLTFEEASQLFSSGVDYLLLFDTEHSDEEDRFICVGPVARGVVLVVMTEREEETSFGSSAPDSQRSRSE